MYKDKISIVVPVYNLENYIERTVSSICSQTYSNLEIILVNDGSHDNSLGIIKKISEKETRIRIVDKENGGVTAARIDGIKIATGDWIGFVDGDDLVEADMFERLLKNAKDYNADISHCGYQMVFPSKIDYYYNTGIIIEQDNQKGIVDLLEGSYVEPGLWNKLYRSDLVKRLVESDKIDTSIRINEDLLINFYLFAGSNKSVYEDFCPYHYMLRQGSAATSRLNENKLRDPLKVLKIIDEEIKNYYSHWIIPQQLVDRRIIGRLIDLSTMEYHDQKDLIKPFEKIARKELQLRLKNIFFGDYSKITKIQACWAGIWPLSYKIVHVLYKKVKGTDKKYEVK